MSPSHDEALDLWRLATRRWAGDPRPIRSLVVKVLGKLRHDEFLELVVGDGVEIRITPDGLWRIARLLHVEDLVSDRAAGLELRITAEIADRPGPTVLLTARHFAGPVVVVGGAP